MRLRAHPDLRKNVRAACPVNVRFCNIPLVFVVIKRSLSTYLRLHNFSWIQLYTNYTSPVIREAIF